jgi:carbonic anhydrase
VAQIVYRSDRDAGGASRQPRDADEAIAWLTDGNRRFASVSTLDKGADRDAGLSLMIEADLRAGEVPEQRPFAIVLGCADARVPIELVFGRSVNDLFVVRLAGNSVGADGIGSISYAVHHFPSVQVAVVLGHTGCGAVAAAVDAFRKPRGFLDLASSLPLRSLVERTLPVVRASAAALAEVHGDAVSGAPGYGDALLHLSAPLNAAYAAHGLHVTLSQDEGSHPRVVWGLYDLATRLVGVLGAPAPGLGRPPAAAEDFRALLLSLAASPTVAELLDRTSTDDTTQTGGR